MTNDCNENAMAGFSAAHGSASLSDADRDALNRLPAGEWFGLGAISFMVRNPRWRCDRLTSKGALESRLVGEWPDTKPEWRKTPNSGKGQTQFVITPDTKHESPAKDKLE